MTPILIWKVIFQPEFCICPIVQIPSPDTLDESSQQLPGGAYTTFRTFRLNHVLHLQDHLFRLEETSRLADTPVVLNGLELRLALREAIAKSGMDEKRVRLTVDLEQQPGTVYIQIESLSIPSYQNYTDGVKVVTQTMQRSNPKAKLTRFIRAAGEIRQAIAPGVNEVLMVDEDGSILEGLSSNFFAVRDGQLWTADDKVLSGITRSLVLEEAERERIPVHFTSANLSEIDGFDEAFITSSSRAVLPVTSIDGKPVAEGRPGPITQRLLALYQDRIAREVQPI